LFVHVNGSFLKWDFGGGFAPIFDGGDGGGILAAGVEDLPIFKAAAKWEAGRAAATSYQRERRKTDRHRQITSFRVTSGNEPLPCPIATFFLFFDAP
jgi:hypothetical protein